MKNITENTTFTLSLVITIAALAFWVGGVAFKTEANAASIEKIVSYQQEVIQRLTRIEAILERRTRRAE